MEELVKLNKLVQESLSIIDKLETLRCNGNNTIAAIEEIHGLSDDKDIRYVYDDAFIDMRMTVCETMLKALDTSVSAVNNYQNALRKLKTRITQ